MENFVRRFGIIILVAAILASCKSDEKTEDTAAKQPQVSEEQSALGKTIYQKHCLACHQTNGSGVPGLYPPLQQTETVNGDNTKLIDVVLNGLQGAITVKGETYNNVMPGNQHLTDEEIAAVINYVRNNFGNTANPVTIEEVEKVRRNTTKIDP